MSAKFFLELSPGEVAAELSRGNDLAILPIYSIEQHGPHLLLGTDGFGAQALAEELGRLTGGLVLPAVPFCWEGCTNVFAGGIGVREAVFLRYVREVVRALWRAGFRRIVVWNTHGGNWAAFHTFPHEVFREDGIPVLCLYGLAGAAEGGKLLHQAGGEAALCAGALRMLGREDLVAKVEETNRRAVAEFGDGPRVELEPRAAWESRRLGAVGHDYSHECLHVQPSCRLDPEKGAEAMRRTALRAAELLEGYRAYIEELQAAGRITRPGGG